MSWPDVKLIPQIMFFFSVSCTFKDLDVVATRWFCVVGCRIPERYFYLTSCLVSSYLLRTCTFSPVPSCSRVLCPTGSIKIQFVMLFLHVDISVVL